MTDYSHLHQKIIAAFSGDAILRGISKREVWDLDDSRLWKKVYSIPRMFGLANRLTGYRVRHGILEKYGNRVANSLAERGILPKEHGLSGLEAYMLAFLMDVIIIRGEAKTAFQKVKPRNQSSPTLIDCGANFGVFTLWLKINFPDASVYTFEPVPRTFRVQSGLVKYWGLAGVYPQQLAVGNKKSELKMFVDPFLWSSTLVNAASHGKNETETVALVPLDSFIAENGIGHIDFLKMDVEGFEAEALEGASVSIAKSCPVLYIAGHHRKDDAEKIPKLVHTIVPDYHVAKDDVLSTEFIFFKESDK